MKPSYSERDYTFGQTMLTLRTVIGLTQAGLANYLGISRRAVGEWEGGSSYPKVNHLKRLIALGIEQEAWTPGQEAEEIRLLWSKAHQKVSLDERWLSALLSQQHASPSHTQPLPAPTTGASETVSRTPTRPTSGTLVDWGDALAVPIFYGRKEELAQLFQWIVEQRCRVVSVLGMGGIGKSALSVSVMYQLAEQFEAVIFRPLRDAPALETLLDDCLQVLAPEPMRIVPSTLEQRISLFLDSLRKRRALVVLDNLEGLLQEGNIKGQLRPGFEGYGELLHQVAGTEHQSCLLLTSREKLALLRPLEGSSVRSLRLGGLDGAACSQLFMEKEVVGTKSEQAQLIEAYSGNPLALKIVGETIFDLFAGEIGPFLTGRTAIFGGITNLLSEQFERLSALEQSVLCWLAIVREPVTLDELLALQVVPLSRGQLLEAIDAGYRRSLIERGKRAGSFTLQSVVLEYVTLVLITEGSREIQQHQLDRLSEHGLTQAHAKEYVRQTQERLLLTPLLQEIVGIELAPPSEQQTVGTRTGASPVPTASVRIPVEAQLRSLLDTLREQNDNAQGYGPANLITLLRLLRGHLSGLDLSHLSVRGVYLQGIEMHDTSLASALIRDTVFTESVNATGCVAISPDGKWWAVGSEHGIIRVWEERNQTLHLSLSAHANMLWSLTFSPDGRTLASGSIDGTVKLWNVENGTLLWMGKQKCPFSLAFSPNGSLLASGGEDATVRIFDAESGTNLQTLTHASPVYAVAFSPDGRWLSSGSFNGEIRLWERQEKGPAIWVEKISTQTSHVLRLAFAPDGRTLASAHRQGTVKLWEVGTLRLLHAFPDLEAIDLAWSPDGHTLACGSDKRIWLWDVEEDRYRAILHGHSADIRNLAFTPDSNRLLSNSVDGMLRLWDVKTGVCVRVVTAYWVSVIGLDWSPDGTRLVSGGNDMLVTIWDASSETALRVLRGHSWVVFGTRWNPNGRLVASCAWDMTIRVWDATTGACVQSFNDPLASYMCLAWSPDGSLLACGTNQGGMQVWDVSAGRLRWVGQPSQTIFFDVAWSADGTQLVSSSSDGSLYLWESTEGTQIRRFSGHHGWVYNVRWSPDGRRLASGSAGEEHGELFVWDVETAECVQTFAGHPGMVYAVAWSADGAQLISGCSDGKLRWWDVKTGVCSRTLEAHQGPINALRVSPDGKWLASCGHDGATRIWDLESFQRLHTLRHDRPYERLNITGIRGLNEVQKTSLQALGAFERP